MESVMPDIVIPIAFPDYKIAVNTPKQKIMIPDLIPGIDLLPDSIVIPETKNRVPDLGHAGVLFIHGKLGTTKYYEYGRYDSDAGNVRKLTLRDVKIDREHPTKASLLYVLSQISAGSGQNGRIMAAYIEVPGKYPAMLDYALKRMAENANPNRKKYDLFLNSCNHFMKGVLDSASVMAPVMIDPRPNSYIHEIRLSFPRLDYSRATNSLQVQNGPTSLASVFPVYAQPAAV
jgi:hypothetical protein